MFVIRDVVEAVDAGETEEAEDADPVRISPVIDTSNLPECSFLGLVSTESGVVVKTPVQPFT